MMPRAALLPLGSYRGVDALDVWEHIRFAEFLEERWRPEEARAEAAEDARFEEECLEYDLDRDPAEDYCGWDGHGEDGPER